MYKHTCKKSDSMLTITDIDFSYNCVNDFDVFSPSQFIKSSASGLYVIQFRIFKLKLSEFCRFKIYMFNLNFIFINFNVNWFLYQNKSGNNQTRKWAENIRKCPEIDRMKSEAD